MKSNNLVVVLSDFTERKLQVLDRFEKYCPICDKKTPQILAYVYQKEKMPIIAIVINIRRYLPEFYGVICENCKTILRSTRYSKEIAKKYGEGLLSSKHKFALEPKPRKIEIRFIKLIQKPNSDSR